MLKKYKDEITKLNDDTIVIKSLTYEEDQEMLMNAIKENYMEEGHEQGIKEGHEQGVKETKIETAKKLLEMLMPIKDIIKVTNLPENKILELQKATKI